MSAPWTKAEIEQQRADECVRACLGIPAPEAALKEAREAFAALIEEADYWASSSQAEGRSDEKKDEALLDRARAALAALTPQEGAKG